MGAGFKRREKRKGAGEGRHRGGLDWRKTRILEGAGILLATC